MPRESNAKWNTPIGMLHSRTQDIQDYVLIGTNKAGEDVVFSSFPDESQAKKLLQNSDLKTDERVGG